MSPLILLPILSALIALIFWAIRHERTTKQASHEERATRARSRGWRYELEPADRVDYRFTGEDGGVGWTLEFKSDGEGRGQAHWKTDSVRARRPELLIVNRTVDKLMQGRLGKWLGRAIAESPEKAEFGLGMYALPHRVELGTDEFRKWFVARAQDPSVAYRVLDHHIQQMLADQRSLSVAFSPRGLEIECGHDVKDIEALERVVRLGCAMAHKLR